MSETRKNKALKSAEKPCIMPKTIYNKWLRRLPEARAVRPILARERNLCRYYFWCSIELETLLERLLESGIHGCTVLDSMGMMRVIDKSGDDLPMFGALRQLFDPARESSKTLMMVLAEDEVHKAKLVVRQVVGGLDHPDTGIMFAVPALFVEGLGANQQ